MAALRTKYPESVLRIQGAAALIVLTVDELKRNDGLRSWNVEDQELVRAIVAALRLDLDLLSDMLERLS